MTPAFFAALLEEYDVALGDDVAASAKASLTGQDDNAAYAESVAVFFGQAVSA